ncbi:MAG: hypothetical protein ACKO38_07200 [Planctomycetota bacterium]
MVRGNRPAGVPARVPGGNLKSISDTVRQAGGPTTGFAAHRDSSPHSRFGGNNPPDEILG